MIFTLFEAASENSYSQEAAYCKAVCKAAVPELLDADFDARTAAEIFALGLDDNLDYVSKRKNNKDIIIMPVTYIQYTVDNNGHRLYPSVQICHAFAPSTISPSSNLPESLSLTPNRVPMVISASGGNSGLSDWYTGAGLEFVEPSFGMYVSGGGSLITSFTITNITDPGGGITRIFASEFTTVGFTGAKWKVHIASVAGFQNNPNGTFNVVAINTGSGYIDITHNLGTGSWTNGTGNVKINYLSGAASAVAAKIYYIAQQRNCSIYEARVAARLTGSQNGTRDDTHGYGSINVGNAIAYNNEIGADQYDTLGAIGTLAVNLANGKATFTHPEVLNARTFKLYRGSEVIHQPAVSYGRSYQFEHTPVKLKEQQYKLRAYRGSRVTEYSNIVTTDIQNLEGLPKSPKFSEGDTVYYLKNGNIESSVISEIKIKVTNPKNNNIGVQINQYKVSSGEIILEEQDGTPRLFFTMRHLLWEKGNRNPLNPFAIGSLPDGLFTELDICGFNFYLTDFTTPADIDFTGAFVIGADFSAATLPAAISDKADFKNAVAKYDPVTTIWTDGQPIGE